MNLPFNKYVEEAEIWQTTNDFLLMSSIVEEKRLYFQRKDTGINPITFFINCPDGSSSWNIWSDQEKTLDILKSKMLDYLQSCRPKTLTDILNRASEELNTLIGAAAGGAKDIKEGKDVDDEDDDDEDDNDDDDDEDDDDEDDEDEDDDFESYYNGGDIDEDDVVDVSRDDDTAADQQFIGQSNSTAVHRLLKDYKALQKSSSKFGIQGQPRGSNLHIWDVKLTDFPPESQLGKDLAEYAKRYKKEPVVNIEMKFPKEYPMAPPFVRVIQPRFKFLTGHVTIGGSICMQMLTRSGWSPGNDIESILVQIRAEIISDTKARLDNSADRPYGEVEAQHAFERMVQRYGWK